MICPSLDIEHKDWNPRCQKPPFFHGFKINRFYSHPKRLPLIQRWMTVASTRPPGRIPSPWTHPRVADSPYRWYPMPPELSHTPGGSEGGKAPMKQMSFASVLLQGIIKTSRKNEKDHDIHIYRKGTSRTAA